MTQTTSRENTNDSRLNLASARAVCFVSAILAVIGSGCHCFQAALPPLAGASIQPVSFNSPDIEGTLTLGTGGVRVLTLDWTVKDISPQDPSNSYNVEVKNGVGQVLGALDKAVTYEKREPNGPGCGDQWFVSISD